jgi:CO/xanthine dehydrogenase FAD-binding subunit
LSSAVATARIDFGCGWSTERMLVDIGRLPELGGMTREGDCIVVGATTRQVDAERAALIAAAAPLLGKALPWVGHPAIRNRGTIGGSIANADPSAEIPLVAVILGAQIVTDDGSAVVSSAADDFFVGPTLTAIRPAACVTQIRFPVWSHGRVGVGFHEVSTRRSDFALVSAVAQVALNDAGRCVDVAVGVGGAGDRPVRLEASSLRLSALDPAAISMAVTTAVADLEVSALHLTESSALNNDLAHPVGVVATGHAPYLCVRFDHAEWNTRVLISMLSRGAASAGAVGSSNAVCGAKRARPSATES